MSLANTTRPDIAKCHSPRCMLCTRFLEAAPLQKALFRILEYLNGTRKLSLTFTRQGRDALIAFDDATYADKESQNSLSGSAVLFGGTAAVWLSRTQRCVAKSSSEVECITLADMAKVMAVGQVLDFLRPSMRSPPPRDYF